MLRTNHHHLRRHLRPLFDASFSNTKSSNSDGRPKVPPVHSHVPTYVNLMVERGPTIYEVIQNLVGLQQTWYRLLDPR